MKKIIHYVSFWLCTLIILFGCEPTTFNPNAVGRITGTVILEDLVTPVKEVLISTNPTTNLVLTDENGNFSLDSIPFAAYSLRASKDGFIDELVTVDITETNKRDVTIVLRELLATNQRPSIPSQPSPQDQADSVGLNVVLSWSSADPDDSTNVTYDVFLINGETALTQIGSSIRDTFLAVDDLHYGKTYFWQVIASDGANEPVNGPVWSFQTTPFPDFPIHFVREENEKFVIYASEGPPEDLTDLDPNQNGDVELVLESIPITSGQESCWRPRISPQRDKIAYLSRVGGQTHLFTMNRDGSERFQVTQSVPVSGYDEEELDFSWSPTGDQLIYMNFGQLFKINRDGTGLSLFAETPVGWAFTEVDWGELVIGVRVREINPYSSVILFFSPFKGVPPDTLLTQQGGQNSGRIGGPNLSPVVESFLYTRDIVGSTNSLQGRQVNAHIFEVSGDAFNTTFDISAVTTGLNIDGFNDLDAIYNPTGSQIIFVQRINDESEHGDIYITTLDGTSRFKLIEKARMPDW